MEIISRTGYPVRLFTFRLFLFLSLSSLAFRLFFYIFAHQMKT